MRFFTVFFAFYLALLACLPCADKAVVVSVGTQTYVSAADHSDSPYGHADWCTPLCQCHCCAGTSLPTAALQLDLFPAAVSYPITQRFATLMSPAARQRPGSIWQPPQA